MKRTRKGKGPESEYGQHYSEEAFWRKLGDMPRTAGLAVVERAVTLYVILTDRATPAWVRLLVIGALGYFIWPLDAVPDVIPAVGLADDASALLLALLQLGQYVTPSIETRVQALLPGGLGTQPKLRKGKSHGKTEEAGEGDTGES